MWPCFLSPSKCLGLSLPTCPVTMALVAVIQSLVGWGIEEIRCWLRVSASLGCLVLTGQKAVTKKRTTLRLEIQ